MKRGAMSGIWGAAMAGVLMTVSALASAQQNYPARVVRLVVPFPAGGVADVLGRMTAQRLSAQYGQQVVVENRAGSGGHVGAEFAARSAPDGYTIMFGTIGIHAAYGIYSKLSYDPARDLQPVILLADLPNILVVHPSVPARNTKEFIALAKARPGELNFGTAGAGSSTHMIGELFKVVAGVNLSHIPYKGSAPAMADLLGGQIHLMFENLPVAIQHVRAGKIRAIGMTSRQRSPSMPEVPTIAETGLPEYEATAWFTIGAAAKVPADIVRKLNTDIDAWLKAPDMQGKWRDMGVTPLGGSPEVAAKFFASETVKWNRVIKAAGIRAD
jgi:tripartite-type tricarboxylate transporter receptor subunit TctC